MASSTVVELVSVSVHYPDGASTITAVKNVNLSLDSGTFTALVGESGSGKSTLLSVAATLVQPTSGEVLFESTSLAGKSEAEYAAVRAEKIGIVFQSPNLLASLNVTEQLLIMDHIRGLRGTALKARRARAEELLDVVGLGGYGTRRITELSGGQRQRVNIARALMAQPRLLLADEPTSALDHQRSSEIVELLATVTKTANVATLMVTHDMSQLDSVDRVYAMADGVIAPFVLPTPAR